VRQLPLQLGNILSTLHELELSGSERFAR